MYAEAGQDRDAERIYRDLYEAADSTPSRLRWVAQLAELAQWSGRRDRLIEALEARRSTNRRSAEPSLALAEAYRVFGDEQERREALLEASRLEPRNIDLTLRIASVERQAGEIDRALASLQRVEGLDTSGRIRARIAELLVLDGRLDEAVEMAGEDAAGMDADAVLRLADSMASLGEWEAAASFLAGQSGRLSDFRIGYMRGAALEEAGREDEARRVFLDVLEVEEERPGVSPGAASQRGAYTSGIYDIMPRGAIELMQVMQGEYQAYSHSGGGAWGYFPGSGGAGPMVHLPATLEECRSLATYHLTRLGEGLEEPARDLLAAAMTERGVALADVLLDMPGGPGFESIASPELLDAHADEPAVLAIVTFYGSYGMGAPDLETQRRAAEMFERRWPTLALLARLSLFNAASEDEAGEAWEKVRETVERLERPEPIATMALAGAVGGAYFNQGLTRSLEPDQSSWLVGRLAEWFESTDRNSQFHQQTFLSLVSAAARTENHDLLASLVESEIEAHRANPASTGPNQLRAMMMSSRGGDPIRRLSMPPEELTGLPGTVLSLLSQEGNMFFGSAGVEPATLAEALGDDDDPLLRAVLAGSTGDTETFVSLIAPMMEAETPSLDAYLLSAAHAGREGEPGRAVRLLGEASYLAMNRATRERLDAATVAYALETPLEGRIGEIARRSALRLLYATRDPETRTALVGALDDLGLDDEAERELDKLASRPSTPTPAMPLAGGRGASGGALERIADALDNGRDEAGVRLAARELEKIGDTILNGNPWMSQQMETQSLVDLVKRRGLEEEVIERADPGDRAGAIRVAKFGAVLELLGREDEAEAAYQRAFEDRAQASTAGPLILLRLKRGDAEGAADVLGALPERQLTMLSQSMLMSMMNDTDGGESALAGAEMVAIHLERNESAEGGILLVANQALAGITRQMWLGGEVLPSLYAIDPEVPGSLEDLQPRRFEAHDRLVEAMLAAPALAESAFGSRTAMARLKGEDLAPLVELAREILTRPVERTPASMQASMRQSALSGFSFGGNDDTETAEPRSPIDLLAEHTAGEDSDGVATEVLEALRENRRPRDAELFEALRTLYSVDRAGFADAAADLLGAPSGPMGAGPDRLVSLTGVLERREIDPLTPLEAVLVHAERALRSPMGMSIGQGALAGYASLVADRAGPDGAAVFAEALAERLIGPEAERAEIIERHHSPNTMMMGDGPAMKLQAFEQVMQAAFLHDRRTVWIAAEYLEPFAGGGGFSGDAFEHAIPSMLEGVLNPGQDAESNPGERVVEFLQRSPLVADGDDFAAFALPGAPQGSVFGRIVRTLGSDRHEQAREAALAWLGGIEPPTLGSTLLAACLRAESASDRYAALDEIGDRIGELNERTRYEVLLALGGADAAPGDLPDAARAALDELLGARASVLDRTIEDALATRVSMQGVSPWEFVNTAASVITDALAAGRDDDAGRVLEHTLKELRRNASWSGGGGAESQLVRALLDGDSVRPAAIAMAIRLDAETGSERMGSSWAMTRALESAAERVPEEALERPGVACATDEEIGEDERRLRATLLDIRDRLGEADTATLVGPLAGRLRGDDAMRRGGNLPAWARERAEGDPSTMWDDIEAAARVARLRGDEEDRRPEDAPWMAGYLERLAARETAPSTIGANSSGSISTASATPGRTPTPPAPPPRISLSR